MIGNMMLLIIQNKLLYQLLMVMVVTLWEKSILHLKKNLILTQLYYLYISNWSIENKMFSNRSVISIADDILQKNAI